MAGADVKGKLVASGDIYKGTHSGWYSISDEAFYSPSQITKLEDGRVVSTETGNEVFLEEEENWKFRLTGYKDRLRDWLSKSECTSTTNCSANG
jgi:methionyl-tRNA synthetase